MLSIRQLSKKGKKYTFQFVIKNFIQKKKHNQAASTIPVESSSFVVSENMTSQASVSHIRPKLQVHLLSHFLYNFLDIVLFLTFIL
jgi:hypothetical protein